MDRTLVWQQNVQAGASMSQNLLKARTTANLLMRQCRVQMLPDVYPADTKRDAVIDARVTATIRTREGEDAWQKQRHNPNDPSINLYGPASRAARPNQNENSYALCVHQITTF